MSFYRLLFLPSLRRSPTGKPLSRSFAFSSAEPAPADPPAPEPSFPFSFSAAEPHAGEPPSSPLSFLSSAQDAASQLPFTRSFAFSSAEEAAAERRRRKRRLRIEPPLHALRRDPNAPRPPRDPNEKRLPETTSSLVGNRLSLHNKVQSLIRSDQLDTACAVARQAVFSNTRPTVFTCNAVVASLYRAGRYDDVAHHFDYFFRQSRILPNVVSYNNLIVAHCEAGRVDVGMDVYRHILAHAPFKPSSITYRHLTKGFVDAGRIGEALEMLREMLNKDNGADSLVYNNVMRGFIKIGDMAKALELFDELRERCLVYDGVVHATLMEAYFEKGSEKEAMDSYKMLMDRLFKMNAVTCNTLLEVLLKYGKMVDALALFDHMLSSHTPPNFTAMDTNSYNLMVNAFFQQNKIGEGIGIFRKTGVKPCEKDVGCYNNIIGKLCDQGGAWVQEAEKLFEEMPAKSVTADSTTYGFLIDVYFREGRADDALRCFAKLVNAASVEDGLNVKLDFFKNLIGNVVEKGLLQEAVEMLGRMSEGSVKPDTECYEFVIVPLCEGGKLDVLRKLMDEMAKNEVPLTASLHEKVMNAFGKEGWREDVERMLQQKVVNAPSSDVNSSTPQFEQVGFPSTWES